MEKLDIKKVYIDTRFKTADSKGDADFTVQLPRSFNIPDDTVCYIDDVAIPVSWPTIGDRNNKLYFIVNYEGADYFFTATLDTQNYNGASIATALQDKMNSAVEQVLGTNKLTFVVSYNVVDNKLTIEFQDLRIIRADTMVVVLLSDADVQSGHYNEVPIRTPESINDNIRLTTTFAMETATINNDTPVTPYECYLNLHDIRNIYIVSSALSNFDTVSNFGLDTIVKKVPVRANYNEIIFDSASEGFDYISLTRRSLDRIDFKLVDSHGSLIDLRNNHWSFSLLFQRQG